MKRAFATAIVILCFALISNCSKKPSDYVELVKGGYLQDYKTTTVGQAFDASFNNPQWKAFETDKGAIVVEFDGVTSQETHENACRLAMAANLGGNLPEADFQQFMKSEMANAIWTPGVPAEVQWTIGVDRKTFHITHLSSPAWALLEATDVLDIIYH